MEAEQVADSWGREDDGLSEPARLWKPSRWIEGCLYCLRYRISGFSARFCHRSPLSAGELFL